MKIGWKRAIPSLEDVDFSDLPVESSPEAVQTGEYQAMIDDDPMAFLESLAARQGANPEEFTTDANLEVPEIDPDSVVIDEPGYVPSETFSFSQTDDTPEPVAEVAEDESWLEASDDFLDGADLDFSQLDDMAEPIVEAGENEDWLEASDTFLEDVDFSDLPVESSPEAVQTGEYQAMIDDDPMAFLESLAARQGANPEEFTTDANLEVPEIDPDSVVIDEPGYVPSETFSFSQTDDAPDPLDTKPMEDLQQPTFAEESLTDSETAR